jgi:hypothetical protein
MSGLSSDVQLSLQPIKDDRARFSYLINLINTLNIEYPVIEIKLEESAAGRGISQAGLAPLISAAQQVNRNAVATSTYEATLLDQKLRSGQMVINKSCVALGVQAQQNALLDAKLKSQQAQALAQNMSVNTIPPPTVIDGDKITCGANSWPLKNICNAGYKPSCAIGGGVSCYSDPIPSPVVTAQSVIPATFINTVGTINKKVASISASISTSSVSATTTLPFDSLPSTSSEATRAPQPQIVHTSLLNKIFAPFRAIWARFFK